MRIPDGFHSAGRIDRPHIIESSPASTPAVRSDPLAPQADGDASSAQTLERLIEAVDGTDEVRRDRVADVSSRLAAGQYETHDAAAQTARAILQLGPE